jgi:hypothetical protein
MSFASHSTDRPWSFPDLESQIFHSGKNRLTFAGMISSSDDMTRILEDLAAGRIDPSEAAHRIDAISASHQPIAEPGRPEPSNEELAAAVPDPDAWASTTDRPQRAGHPTDAFPTAPSAPADHLADHLADHVADHVAAATGRPAAAAAARPEPAPATAANESEAPRRVTPRPSGAVERISIRAVGRRVRIVGEPSVATVAADGPHVLRRNGSVMEISSDGEIGASIDGFQLLRGAPRNLEDFRALSLGKELFIRVNPNIAVDVEVTAGSLHTERVPVLGKVRVTAGGAKLLDVEEIADALVQAGQATIRGTLREGRSRVRAESGSLVLQLSDRSDVTIHSEAQLGKVSWSGQHDGAGDEVVMGNGRARLDVEVVMGYAQVQAGSVATAGAK